MNELLEKIEREVVEEFTQKLSLNTNESLNGILIQMTKISAQVTKEFIKKYEQEKSL